MNTFSQTLEGRMAEFTERRLLIAVRSLGAHEALLDYALKALRGETSTDPHKVADFITTRLDEIKALEKADTLK